MKTPRIYSTKDTPPKFPCWLWSELFEPPKWVRYEKSQGYTGYYGWHTRWTPDEPDPKTVYQRG